MRQIDRVCALYLMLRSVVVHSVTKVISFEHRKCLVIHWQVIGR